MGAMGVQFSVNALYGNNNILTKVWEDEHGHFTTLMVRKWK
jgi:hypothetical protein